MKATRSDTPTTLSTLQDSIDTCISLRIFDSREQAAYQHVFCAKRVSVPASAWRSIVNFNPLRLQPSVTEAYPVHDRPRGSADLASVKYCQSQIRNKGGVTPIWMVRSETTGQYVLVDGAHRLVASHLERKKSIPAYVISAAYDPASVH